MRSDWIDEMEEQDTEDFPLDDREVRNAALEEAAKVVNAIREKNFDGSGKSTILQEAIDAIRALKDT